MGDDIHIPAASVEVCKNEGLFVFWKGGAIAAAPLALSCLHIKGLCLQHPMHEGADFRVHVIIHLFCGLKNALGVQQGLWNRPPAVDRIVVKGDPVNVKLPGDSLFQLFYHRNQVFLNIVPEGFHHCCIIIQASHPVVAQLCKALVAQFVRNDGADLHQAIVKVIQFFFMFL